MGSDDGISNRLLSCWEGQENLNVQILKELGGKTDEKWLEIPIGDDALVFNTSESPATWAQLPIPIPIDDEG